jgi:DNA excision repair protein ERCC-6
MDHDAILGVHESEKAMIDHEASRVAERAALALQQSRRLRSAENVAVPTWTGRSGAAGAPAGVRQRFGSTSNTRLVASSSASSQNQTRNGETGQQPATGSSLAGASAGRAFTSADLLARVRERKLDAPGKTSNFCSIACSAVSKCLFSCIQLEKKFLFSCQHFKMFF